MTGMQMPMHAPTMAMPAQMPAMSAAPITSYVPQAEPSYAAPQQYAQPAVQHVAHTVMETQMVPVERVTQVPQTQQTMHTVMETQTVQQPRTVMTSQQQTHMREVTEMVQQQVPRTHMREVQIGRAHV